MNTKTLVIDGDNTLIRGFSGKKDTVINDKHIGGIFFFLNKIKQLIDDYSIKKVVVFWDSFNSSFPRTTVYKYYKKNRRYDKFNDFQKSVYEDERLRVKEYLEELFIRQGEYEFCEADDCISYYCANTPKEEKIIASSDKDLCQLIDNNTSFYNYSDGVLYKKNDTILFDKVKILVENVKLAKIICGDDSDNIFGISSLGCKKLINFFPDLENRECNINFIIQEAEKLHKNDKNSKALKNLLSGMTKNGVYGDEFFKMNETVIDLKSHLFLSDEAKNDIYFLINDVINPESRTKKNVLTMMEMDGLFGVLSKSNWTNFLTPFSRIESIEKSKYYLKNKVSLHEK